MTRQALQTHQRGVADAIGDGWVMRAPGERIDPEAKKAVMITANLARPYRLTPYKVNPPVQTASQYATPHSGNPTSGQYTATRGA